MANAKDEEFLRRALDLAVGNVTAGRGGPFGALIVLDGEIVAEGTNVVTAASDPTAHAEIVAIREACRRLNRFHLGGAIIYSSCEPCPMCLGAIYWARLDRLCFAASREDAAAAGFDDSFFYSEVSRPWQDRTLPARRLLAAEARRPFEAWRQAPHRVLY